MKCSLISSTLAGGMTISCRIFNVLDVQLREFFKLGLIAGNDVFVRIVSFAKQALMPRNGAIRILVSIVNIVFKSFS